ELSQRILEHDPALLADSPSVVTTLPRWTSHALPFVGRVAEEEFLIERLRGIAAGGARMVLVSGEPGIGKSRLVLEIARRVADDAIVVPISGDDTFRPVLPAIASTLVEPTLQLSDAELRPCVGRWPGDVCSLAPSLRARLPGCPPA